MRPDGIIVFPPLLDDDLRLLQAVEDFSVQQLIAELAIEALVIIRIRAFGSAALFSLFKSCVIDCAHSNDLC